MTKVMQSFSASAPQAEAFVAQFIALPRINQLLVISHSEAAWTYAKRRLDRIDVVAEGPGRRIFIYPVENGNATELAGVVRAGDVVMLHDPQPAGLIPALVAHGAIVVWRCHIGSDHPSPEVDLGWAFLAPYLGAAHAYVFSHEIYAPAFLDRRRLSLVHPTIDAFSAKNMPIDPRAVRAILAHVGLIEGPVAAAQL